MRRRERISERKGREIEENFGRIPMRESRDGTQVRKGTERIRMRKKLKGIC